MLGKALFERIPICAPLSHLLLKQILHPHAKFQLKDIKLYDENIFRSLNYLAKNPVDGFDWKFAVDHKGKVQELVIGGKEKEVNEQNKLDFIQKM